LRAVGRHEAEHLRRFLDARARGDAAAMRQWWEELVIDLYDRVDGLVHAAHRGRLDDREHEDAVGLSLARISERLIHTFRGESMGELVNATATLARGICIDVQRASVRRRRHEGTSLDAGWDADVEDRPAPAWEAAEATRRFDAADRGENAQAFLDWALPQLQDRRRAVVTLTLHGAELPEIMAELGLSRDNAYQLRSRGLKDLRQLKERFDA
jgi:DNA-directed RNA polymerase specialized sigma24 family protein